MLSRLVKKEFRLCLHPAAILMLTMSAMALIPNYPFGVLFFYMTLGVFFICLGARENHDVTYTMTLPVPKKELVTARFLLAAALELLQLALTAGFILLRRALGDQPNAAGLDANLALIGEGFIFFGVFQLVFFPGYYRDVNRVGVNFIKSSAAMLVLIVLDIVLCYTVPLFCDVLDTPDPQHLPEKLVFTAIGLVFWLGASLLALRLSQRRFQRLDIR